MCCSDSNWISGPLHLTEHDLNNVIRFKCVYLCYSHQHGYRGNVGKNHGHGSNNGGLVFDVLVVSMAGCHMTGVGGPEEK